MEEKILEEIIEKYQKSTLSLEELLQALGIAQLAIA